MAIHVSIPRPVLNRSTPLFILSLLALASALASFAFACATPFAAFAVVAAATLPLSSALCVVMTAWIVNQTIGFGALHYPVDTAAVLWGIIIGAAVLAATAAAAAVLRFARGTNGFAGLGLALAAAYAAYELALGAATPFLGGEDAFAAAIVGRIGLLNVVWLIGLIAATETARLVNSHLRRRTAPQSAARA
ncbi:MAG: hypothetical protein J2P53_06805 [Bradyrhizobiaceae bacterium]|nr:hypothetical protein [Bradyrhizobiaceae bacterium]